MKRHLWSLCFGFLVLCSCAYATCHSYQLCVLVSSRALDYTNAETFFESLLKQKGTPTVGHAWIKLIEKEGSVTVREIEGGHSGEFGVIAPQYFTRLLKESENPAIENPVQVLYQPIFDGCLEFGNGGHVPTFKAIFELTEEGFSTLLTLLDDKSGQYAFSKWSMTENNCVRFVLTCLGRIGIVLDATNVVQIPPVAKINGLLIKMWKDERYSKLEVVTPEKLESELRQLVALGMAREVSESETQ